MVHYTGFISMGYYCFNLECTNPRNKKNKDFCAACKKPLVLHRKYATLEVLGEGGFGRTYLGVDLQRGTHCAIKQLFPRDRSGAPISPHTKELFRREAGQLKRLGGDPQIPFFIDFFEENSMMYLVSEYIEGATLTSIVCPDGERTRVFNESEVITFLSEMLRVLQKVHNAKVVHRDIKPDNIILRRATGYVLIDFGGVRLVPK